MIKQRTIIACLRASSSQIRKYNREIYSKLECDIIEPKRPHTSTFIWLHGLGQDSKSFINMIRNIVPSSTRVVLPNAPERKVSIHNDYKMRAWYDVQTLEKMGNVANKIYQGETLEDREGILASKKLITQLIDSEFETLAIHGESQEKTRQLLSGDVNGFIPHLKPRIIVGGYDIGGAIAILSGLSYPHHKLTGIISASGYVPLQSDLHKTRADIQRSVPVYAMHGKEDEFVDYHYAMDTYKDLRNTLHMPNINISLDETQAHEVTMEEVSEICEIVEKLLKDTPRIHAYRAVRRFI
jgi:predicted esterase